MKLLTQTIVLALALICTAGAVAQTGTWPANVTRQRKATTDVTPTATPEVKPDSDPAVSSDATVDKDKSRATAPSTAVTTGPFSAPTPATVTPATQKKGDQSKSKDTSNQLTQVTADGQTNRRDQEAEQE